VVLGKIIEKVIKLETSLLDNVRSDAEQVYRSGALNCAEAIVHVIKNNYALHLPAELLSAASGFGAGVGGAKCLCSAVSASVLVLGYFFGREFPTTITDPQSQKAIALSFELQEALKQENNVHCCYLLTHGVAADVKDSVDDCARRIGIAAVKTVEIIDRELNVKQKAAYGIGAKPELRANLKNLKSNKQLRKTVNIRQVQYDAEEVFRIGGYYCSEAIVSAIRLNFDPSMPRDLIKAAGGYPIGVGKSRCMCGAISGAVVALGYFFGKDTGNDAQCAALCYELQESFRKNHQVTLCCFKHIEGMDIVNAEHKKQCVAFTGEMAVKTAEIIARELNITLTYDHVGVR